MCSQVRHSAPLEPFAGGFSNLNLLTLAFESRQFFHIGASQHVSTLPENVHFADRHMRETASFLTCSHPENRSLFASPQKVRRFKKRAVFPARRGRRRCHVSVTTTSGLHANHSTQEMPAPSRSWPFGTRRMQPQKGHTLALTLSCSQTSCKRRTTPGVLPVRDRESDESPFPFGPRVRRRTALELFLAWRRHAKWTHSG
jgi:hypothetical protein